MRAPDQGGFYEPHPHHTLGSKKMMIVDPTTKPLPLVATLVDNHYHDVTKLTLPEMTWPEHIRWRGRVFGIYHVTRVIPTPEEISRTQLYREIEIWDAP